MKLIWLWSPLRTILTLIAAWILGSRLSIAYVYSVNSISNPAIIRDDLVIAAFVGFLILANLHLKYRPTRAQAIHLMILGLIVAAVAAFITLEIYGAIMG
jgi:glucan phosphoethanolaminetransferase (alkaline phosphatase superfamily)